MGIPLIVKIRNALNGEYELRYTVYYEKDSMKIGCHWNWRYGNYAYELSPEDSEVIAWVEMPNP